MDTIACLSPFTEHQVRELAGTDDVKVLLVPDPPAPEAVREVVSAADIVISDMRHKHRLDRDTIAAMRRCRLIQQPAVGFDVIDHRAAAEFGIPLANAAGFNADTVADWTLMGMLTVVRHGARADREMRAGGWRPADLRAQDMRALTVGIVGMGNIGRQVAARLAGFGSRILYSDVVERDLPGCERVSFERLLEISDIVTLHVPLDGASRALIGRAELARMRPGAILCNASRGPIVDEAALVEALESGHLGGAALDVFEVEPLAADSPLRRMDNVFLNPHIAGGSDQARVNLLDQTAANIRRVLAGEPPVNVVNGL
ncbi:2-hydroxyacid dehydrogenase [Pseudonocardia nigra]|uniref:2-hydroxyacid dehydrogenase n=1 Tax=Pseudonocardia nigra TaxID=1921578 RepID=UPI001C5F2B46|nr:2-hydroxyacid dehydrogenase [Pseudonocardia nigra]